MLILFDHGTPSGIAQYLTEHTVKEARAQGWDRLTNGELLKAAEDAGFDLLLSTDVVLGKARWQLIKPQMTHVVAAVNAAQPGTYTEVDIPSPHRF